MNLEGYDLNVKLRSSISKGAGWLAGAVEEDGRFENCPLDLASYYKSLLLFAVTGHVDEGSRCLNFLKDNLVGENIDLCNNGRKTSLERMQRNLANYMDGWVAIGSWLLGDYSFAEMVCDELKKQQSSLHGGIMTGIRVWALRERYDLATAASCARAFLMTGNRKAAAQAAEFICEALEKQTDLLKGLDLSFDKNWNVVREEDSSERSYYRFLFESRGEKVWFPAFCSAVLSEIYSVFRRKEYLAAAESYFDFISLIPEFRDGTLANGKSAWAAGLLAQITGKEKYREAFYRTVRNVLARQRPSGEFGASGEIDFSQGQPVHSDEGDDENTVFARRYERTAEFTGWAAVFLRIDNFLRAREKNGKPYSGLKA